MDEVVPANERRDTERIERGKEMKEHFCPAEQSTITYQGECSWCGEKESLAQTQEPVVYQCPRCATSMQVDLTAKAALAQTQEPDDIASILACRDMLDAQPVPPRTWVGSGDLEDSNAYLTPPQRTWVGLDHQDKKKFSSWLDHKTDDEVFTAIDDLLREMNT